MSDTWICDSCGEEIEDWMGCCPNCIEDDGDKPLCAAGCGGYPESCMGCNLGGNR